jgi:hypothetical protein
LSATSSSLRPNEALNANIDSKLAQLLHIRAVLKLVTGGLVVRWVTTGESPLLYVFAISFVSLDLLVLNISFPCLRFT